MWSVRERTGEEVWCGRGEVGWGWEGVTWSACVV